MRSKHQGHAAEVGVLIRMLKLSTFPHLYMVYFRFRNDSMRQRWAKRRQLTIKDETVRGALPLFKLRSKEDRLRWQKLVSSVWIN